MGVGGFGFGGWDSPSLAARRKALLSGQDCFPFGEGGGGDQGVVFWCGIGGVVGVEGAVLAVVAGEEGRVDFDAVEGADAAEFYDDPVVRVGIVASGFPGKEEALLETCGTGR